MPKQVLFNRENILDELIPLFIEQGYNGTSMSDIVERTGLNRSSIYNSFGDKMALYEEVLERYTQHQSSLSQAMLNETDNVKLALKAFFQKLFAPENGEVKGCLVTKCSLEMAGQSQELKLFLTQNKEQMVNWLKELIERGQERGQITKNRDAKSLALFLFNNLQGLRITESVTEDPTEIEEVIDQLFEVL